MEGDRQRVRKERRRKRDEKGKEEIISKIKFNSMQNIQKAMHKRDLQEGHRKCSI